MTEETKPNGQAPEDDLSFVSLVEPPVTVKPKPEAAPVEDSDAALRRELVDTKAQMMRERSSRERAEQEVRELQAYAGRSQNDVRGAQIIAMDNAIGARMAEKSRLAALRIEALQSGDYVKESELNDQISVMNAELVTLRQGKAQAEAEAKQQPQPQQHQPQADPVETYLRSTGIHGKSADWIRAHPDVIRYPVEELRAAHNAARRNNLTVESDEYFDKIADFMGVRQERAAPAVNNDPVSEAGQAQPAQERPAAQPQPQRRVAAAPPSRPAAGGSAGDGGIRLTPQQRRAAEISGVSDEVYAQNIRAAAERTKQGMQ